MKHFITQTKNGRAVYIDLIYSPSATTIAEQPYILKYVRQILPKTTASENQIRLETNMGRAVGYDFVTTTTEDTVSFYGKLLKETAYTRFVKKGEPKSTSFMSVVLRRDADGDYELYKIWIGRLHPSIPDSPDEMPESKAFWKTHAYIFNHQNIAPRSITTVCPYTS